MRCPKCRCEGINTDCLSCLRKEATDLRAQLAAAEKRATEAWDDALQAALAVCDAANKRDDDNNGAAATGGAELAALEISNLQKNPARAQAVAEFLTKLRKTWEDDSAAALIIEVGDFFAKLAALDGKE